MLVVRAEKSQSVRLWANSTPRGRLACTRAPRRVHSTRQHTAQQCTARRVSVTASGLATAQPTLVTERDTHPLNNLIWLPPPPSASFCLALGPLPPLCARPSRRYLLQGMKWALQAHPHPSLPPNPSPSGGCDAAGGPGTSPRSCAGAGTSGVRPALKSCLAHWSSLHQAVPWVLLRAEYT